MNNNQKIIIGLMALVLVALILVVGFTMVPKMRIQKDYTNAENEFSNGNYMDSFIQFVELDDYKNSRGYIVSNIDAAVYYGNGEMIGKMLDLLLKSTNNYENEIQHIVNAVITTNDREILNYITNKLLVTDEDYYNLVSSILDFAIEQEDYAFILNNLSNTRNPNKYSKHIKLVMLAMSDVIEDGVDICEDSVDVLNEYQKDIISKIFGLISDGGGSFTPDYSDERLLLLDSHVNTIISEKSEFINNFPKEATAILDPEMHTAYEAYINYCEAYIDFFDDYNALDLIMRTIDGSASMSNELKPLISALENLEDALNDL